MGHAKNPRFEGLGGTPTVHAPAWDPSSHGRGWDSNILNIDQHTSRIATSTQRWRDGTVVPARAETLLSAAPHTTTRDVKLAGHPQLMRDGSPRNLDDRVVVWKWDNLTPDWTTSQSFVYGNPHMQAGAAARPNRHAGAMPSRVSPAIYATVFGRKPGEPVDSPRAMPPQSKVATRGAAHVPTIGHWADPPARAGASLTSLPKNPDADDEYRLKLLEAQLRSEERLKMAKLALAADVLAIGPNLMPSPRRAMTGALTSRF